MAVALMPASASAQFYGFPSEFGVLDDGFGVLPPLPPAPLPPAPPPLPAGFADAPPPPFFAGPPAAPPPSPPCPLVIRIGRGLKHAGTRVVYDRPGCS